MPRFNNFREITARFDSTGTCGHAIRKGDRIGYARGNARCADCWRKWASEVAAETAVERGDMPNCL